MYKPEEVGGKTRLRTDSGVRFIPEIRWSKNEHGVGPGRNGPPAMLHVPRLISIYETTMKSAFLCMHSSRGCTVSLHFSPSQTGRARDEH